MGASEMRNTKRVCFWYTALTAYISAPKERGANVNVRQKWVPPRVIGAVGAKVLVLLHAPMLGNVAVSVPAISPAPVLGAMSAKVLVILSAPVLGFVLAKVLVLIPASILAPWWQKWLHHIPATRSCVVHAYFDAKCIPFIDA